MQRKNAAVWCSLVFWQGVCFIHFFNFVFYLQLFCVFAFSVAFVLWVMFFFLVVFTSSIFLWSQHFYFAAFFWWVFFCVGLHHLCVYSTLRRLVTVLQINSLVVISWWATCFTGVIWEKIKTSDLRELCIRTITLGL